MHLEYSQHLCSLQQAQQLAKRPVVAADLFGFVRMYANDQSIRKRGSGAGGGNN